MGNTQSAKDAMEGSLKKFSACMSKDTGEGADTVGLEPVGFGTHGPEVFVDGLRVHGDGVALCSESMSQDKSYFQCKIVVNGDWAVGVAKESAQDDAKLGGKEGSWGMDAKKLAGEVEITEGDVLGITYDQGDHPTSLKFYHNGKVLEKLTITGVRGEVFPAVSVAGGATLELEFDGENGFIYPPPSGFNAIMQCRSLM